jgi:hypothetical protein
MTVFTYANIRVVAEDNTINQKIIQSSAPACKQETDSIYANIRALVAEDKYINQKAMRRMLDQLGLQHIDIVENGQEAVDREASQRYDAILMDIQMPVNGRSRSHPADRSATPVGIGGRCPQDILCHSTRSRCVPDLGRGCWRRRLYFQTSQLTKD